MVEMVALELALLVIPQFPPPNQSFVVEARSETPYTNITLTVGDNGNPPIKTRLISVSRDGPDHVWTWEVDPIPLRGEYTLLVDSDQGDFAYALYIVAGQPRMGDDGKRIDYERTYVLMDPMANADLASRVIDTTWDVERWTLGGSADDSGIGDLTNKTAIVLNPHLWGPGEEDQEIPGIEGFLKKHYPGTKYWPLVYNNNVQLEGRLLAYSLKQSGLVLECPTTHPTCEITSEFGANESWRNGVIHIGLDFRSSFTVWEDEALSATDGVVVEAGWHNNQGGFGYRVRIEHTLPDGRKVLIRYAHLMAEGVYVEIGDEVVVGQKLGAIGTTGISTGDHLHIDVYEPDRGYADPELVLEKWDGESPPDPDPDPGTGTKYLSIGVHDKEGGEWMVQNNVEGYALALLRIEFDRIPDHQLDYRFMRDNGVIPIVRINSGWADGSGTIVPDDKLNLWIDNCEDAITRMKGEPMVVFTNEGNNPSEWPGGWPNPTFIPSPHYFVRAFNLLRERFDTEFQFTIGAWDPYNVVAQQYGQPGDPRDWANYAYAHCTGLDWVALHAKTQGADPRECSPAYEVGRAVFTDAPLIGRYQHLATLEDQFEWIPPNLREKPIIVTELNPQRRYDGSTGWDSDGGVWIEYAMEYIAGLGWVDGVCIYRYVEGGNPSYALSRRDDLLQAIQQWSLRTTP